MERLVADGVQGFMVCHHGEVLAIQIYVKSLYVTYYCQDLTLYNVVP